MNIDQIKSMLVIALCDFELDFDDADTENGIRFDIYMNKYQNWFGDFTIVDTQVFNKRGYKRFEALCERLSLKTNDYELFVSYDVSGYSYWTKDMQESNYMCVVVHILNENGDFSKFKEDVENFMTNLHDEYIKLLSRESYIRKSFESVN